MILVGLDESIRTWKVNWVFFCRIELLGFEVGVGVDVASGWERMVTFGHQVFHLV